MTEKRGGEIFFGKEEARIIKGDRDRETLRNLILARLKEYRDTMVAFGQLRSGEKLTTQDAIRALKMFDEKISDINGVRGLIRKAWPMYISLDKILERIDSKESEK